MSLLAMFSAIDSIRFSYLAGYIGEFEIVDDHRSGKIVVNLTGRLNKCGVISPRFDVPINDIEKWTNNLLPSRQFGYVVTYKLTFLLFVVTRKLLTMKWLCQIEWYELTV
jgi:hypothetical protein